MEYNTVFINGQAFNCSNEMSLKDLLLYLDFNLNLIAVEYNKQVLTNDSFHQIFLSPRDQIEIITIVGGG